MKKYANTTLPRLSLAQDEIAMKAESGGCYCFQSEIPKTVFCVNGDNTLIVTRSLGYLAVAHEDLPMLVEELRDLLDDLGRIKEVTA